MNTHTYSLGNTRQLHASQTGRGGGRFVHLFLECEPCLSIQYVYSIWTLNSQENSQIHTYYGHDQCSLANLCVLTEYAPPDLSRHTEPDHTLFTWSRPRKEKQKGHCQSGLQVTPVLKGTKGAPRRYQGHQGQYRTSFLPFRKYWSQPFGKHFLLIIQ